MHRSKTRFAIAAASFLIAAAAAAYAESPSYTYSPEKGAIALTGPWERYEGILPGEALDPARATKVDFPLGQALPASADEAAQGAATYRMAIRLEGGAAASRLALYLPAITNIRAVYAGDLKVFDASRDPVAPPLLLFDATGRELSIILQADPGAALDEASSFPAFVLFGEARAVSLARLWLGAAAALLDGYFLLAGAFALALFLFWKKNREILAFALYLIVVGLYYAFKDGAIFLGLPGIDGRGRLEALRLAALSLQYAALAFFMSSLYRSRLKGLAAAPFYAIPAALAAAAAAAAILPLPGLARALALATAAYGALFLLSCLAFAIAMAAKGDRKARWLIPALAAVPAAWALAAFGPRSLWNALLTEPAGIALFGVVAALMLVKKVADSCGETETLTDYVASMSRTVNSFIPKEFLEHLEKDRLTDLRLGDHAKKEMTIFFSDIRAFTELSEGLTVEENFAFINSYLSRVVPVIRENGGFVDKYVGDGIMALFPGPKGPDEAIRSAINMQIKMVEYNGHRAKMGYRPISMGVGVHTGDLMLGVVGIPERMENTVISDAVNLSSRLQSITKAFNISLAISEQAFKELEDPGVYKYRFIGKVKVKGKAEPVSVFEIFDGIAQDLFERKMKANMFFEQGMLSYYQKDFAGAMYYFRHVLEIIPEDGAASFYLDNCMNKATL